MFYLLALLCILLRTFTPFLEFAEYHFFVNSNATELLPMGICKIKLHAQGPRFIVFGSAINRFNPFSIGVKIKNL